MKLHQLLPGTTPTSAGGTCTGAQAQQSSNYGPRWYQRDWERQIEAFGHWQVTRMLQTSEDSARRLYDGFKVADGTGAVRAMVRIVAVSERKVLFVVENRPGVSAVRLEFLPPSNASADGQDIIGDRCILFCV